MNQQRTTKFSVLRATACGLAMLLAASCGGAEKEAYDEKPVDALYNSAMEQLLEQDYLKAASAFEEVERQHPYSVWAAKAQVMSAYAYFRRDKYDDSINAVDRFIQLHPTSPDAPYAYYLKSLAYYEQIVDVGRDQRTTERALASLEDVVRRFPETQYARDATLKLDLTKDHLAGKEMDVGRFYLKRGELLAAVNRFKSVVEKHQTTSHVPEALLRLVEAYTALGLKNEAQRMAAILGYNYPGSPWYADAYELVEGVELENFPRPDKRQFYERWLDPDATIAKAERREIPQFSATLPQDLKKRAPTGTSPDTPDVAVAPVIPDAPAIPETPGEARAVERKALDEAPKKTDIKKPEVSTPTPGPKPEPTPVVIAKAEPKPAPVIKSEVQPELASEPDLEAESKLGASPAREAQPKTPPRPLKLTAAERAALSAESESQRLAASQAAGEWRRASAAASTEAGRKRADANVRLADAAAGYWAARGDVAAASTSTEEAVAELKLAEQSVSYWQAVKDAAEDDLARQQADAALDQANKVLTYWRENGRRPTWLERTVRSLS